MAETILLVNPPIYDFAAHDFFNKPLGLLYLGARLRQAGYEVTLVDALDRHLPDLTNRYGPAKVKPNGTGKYHRERIDRPACLKHVRRIYYRHGLPTDMLAEALQTQCASQRPAAALVTSMMTYWYPAVADTIDLIRRTIPDVPVALGGVYATLMPDHARRVCRPDALFAGAALTPVLQWLSERTGREGQVPSLDEGFQAWPTPAYDLYQRLDYLTLMTSLGCPYRCDYCASGRLQPTLEQLEPEHFADHLVKLLPLVTRQNDHYNISLMDDALLANGPDHIVGLLDHIDGLNLPLRFHCPNGLHARFVSRQVAELMHANDFRMIRLSYEAASRHSKAQDASDGKITDRLFSQAVMHLEAAGFGRDQLQAYVLAGLPGQSMAEMERTAAVVHDMGVQIRLCQYSPIPGTALFADACADLGIPTDEPLLHNNTIIPCLTTGISMGDFQQFKDRVNGMNDRLARQKDLELETDLCDNGGDQS